MRNEALVAGYRQAGYESVWRSAPGCCRLCNKLNGQTVTTLKPPLHKGCGCTVVRGEKVFFTEDINDGIIHGEWDGANFKDIKAAEKHKTHLKEYGDISFEDCVKGARSLLNTSPSERVFAHTGKGGAVYRYDSAENDLAVGLDGIILTRFRPKGEGYWESKVLTR